MSEASISVAITDFPFLIPSSFLERRLWSVSPLGDKPAKWHSAKPSYNSGLERPGRVLAFHDEPCSGTVTHCILMPRPRTAFSCRR
jgi:hypothetical protein